MGDEEVFLLCEKVNRKEIRVRFFELDADGSQVWNSFASFNESDVHHQVAIVFKTPAYKDLDICDPVHVYVQLYRPKDGESSEARTFTYFPREGVKKRRLLPTDERSDYHQHSSTQQHDCDQIQGQTSGVSPETHPFTPHASQLF